VRRHSGVPVAANQASWGRHAILEIIWREAADVVMTDPPREGGLLALQGYPDYLADDYVTRPVDYSGGKMRLGDAPGLGFEIDRTKVKAFHQAFLKEGHATAYASAKAGAIATIPRD